MGDCKALSPLALAICDLVEVKVKCALTSITSNPDFVESVEEITCNTLETAVTEAVSVLSECKTECKCFVWVDDEGVAIPVTTASLHEWSIAIAGATQDGDGLDSLKEFLNSLDPSVHVTLTGGALTIDADGAEMKGIVGTETVSGKFIPCE